METPSTRNYFKILGVLFIACFIFSSNLKAQTLEPLKCGSAEPSKEYYESSKLFLQNSPNLREQIKNPISVAISVKMTRKTDGTGGLSINLVQSAIDKLNQKFTGTNITFYLYNNAITYVDNDKYYLFSTDDEEEITKKYDVNYAVNLYLVHSFKESIGGYTYFPSTDKATNRVFAYFEDASDLIDKVIPHEFGHYFGLFHTFQGNHTSSEEYVTRSQLSNCDYAGDLLCDTPADPYGKLYILGYLDCSFPYTFSDKLSEQYHPATDNLMSYYRGCGNNFTNGQINLMTFGISERLAPNNNILNGYDIRGYSPDSNIIFTTKNLKKINNEYAGENICIKEKYLLEYSNSLNNNAEVEVYALSSDYKVRHLVGKGTKSPIEIDLSTIPLLYSDINFQVVSSDEKHFGTLSSSSYSVLDIPKGTISGSSTIFSGENATYFMDVNGGKAEVEIEDLQGNIYKSFKDFRINKLQTLKINQTTELRVKSIKNICGVGSVSGLAKVTVSSAPTANLIVINAADPVWCRAQEKTIDIVANGTPPPIKSLNVFSVDKNEKITGISYEHIFDKLVFKPINANSQLPNEVFIEIEFENIPEKIKSKSFYFAEPLKYALTKQIEAERLQNISIKLEDTFFAAPTDLVFNDYITKTVFGKNPSIDFASLENQNFSLSKIVNPSCQLLDIAINVELKVKDNLKIDIVREANSCIGEKKSVSINKSEAFVSNTPEILFYDELDKSVAINTAQIDGNNLTFTIPENIQKEGYHYFRIKMLGGFLSQKSNKFFISTLPNVDISGFYNSSYDKKNLIKSIEGTFPISVKFNNGLEQSINNREFILSNEFFTDGNYQIEKMSNICGSKSSDKSFIISKNTFAPKCVGFRTTGDGTSGSVTLFTIKEPGGKTINKQVGDRFGINGYKDLTNSIIHVSKYTKYAIEASTWSSRSITGGGGNGEKPVIWIDYNQNGAFEANERIQNSGNTYSFSLEVNDLVKPGYYLMRISTTNEETSEIIDPCSITEKLITTSDYTLKIENYDSGSLPRLKIDINKKSYCFGSPIDFSIYREGANINDKVNVKLKDRWGNLLQNYGDLNFGTHSKSIDYEIFENESNLTLEVFDSKSGVMVNSDEFFIIKPAKVTFTGTSFGTKGKKSLITYNLEGGSNIDITFSINGGEQTINTDYYGNSVYLRTFSSVFNYSQIVKPIRAIDKVCGVAHVSGSSAISILQQSEGQAENLDFGGGAGYTSCETEFSFNYQKKDNTAFGENNYITAQLIDSKGNYIYTLDYYKSQNLLISSSKKERPGIYYVKLISSQPILEYYLFPLELFFKNNVTTSKSKKTFEGDIEYLELKSSLNYTRFNLNNTPFEYVMTSNYRLPLNLIKGESVNITSSNLNFCGKKFPSITYKNDPIPFVKGEISILSPKNACVGGKVEIPYLINKELEINNIFEFNILNQQNKIVETGLAIVENGNLKINQKNELDPTKKYRIRVNSTNPYIESKLTEEISFSPKLEAILNGSTQTQMYAGSKIPVIINLRGESPYAITLNNGQVFQNIKDSIYTFNLVADTLFPKIFISKITSACGEGQTKGELNLEIFEIPKISISPIDQGIYCVGSTLGIEYATIKGKFINDPKLILELVNDKTGEATFIKSIDKINGSTEIKIPKSSVRGATYSLRITNTEPYFNSKISNSFQIEDIPSASILNDITGFEGFNYNIRIQINSNTKTKLTIDGENFETDQEIFTKNIKLSNTQNKYKLDKISNYCGEGQLNKNTANINILPNSEAAYYATVYPNPISNQNSTFSIKLKEPLLNNPTEIHLITASGQLVESKTIPLEFSKEIGWGLSGLSHGVYFLNFKIKNLQFTKKIIIE